MFCLPTLPSESAQAQESFNLWDRSNNNRNIPRREPQPRITDEEYANRIANSFQGEMDTARDQSRTLLNYGIFLGIAGVIIAGFVCWQIWRQKNMAREFDDPMFLVQELNSVHQLSEPEKRVMRELSEKHLLPTPLKLFVEPKFLLDAWENETFASSQPTVQRLLSKLFDIAKA